jgi:hypothetical protein
VARKEGVSRTSTELRVEWNELKRRMTAATGVSRLTARPAFVALVAPQTESLSECTIELEGRRGKLRIQLKRASANFPEACRYVLETLGKVYQTDAQAREKRLSPEGRLLLHQEHSVPLMDELHE